MPQQDLIELKTVREFKWTNWKWIYPQLYLSGTPCLILGSHAEGKFSKIKHHIEGDPLALTMQAARQRMQPGLNKLAAVLRALHARVLQLTEEDSTRRRLLSLVYVKGGRLELYERTDGAKVPESLLACFDA